MRIAFYSNYLNHHQVLVAEELFKLLGKEYMFVATLPRNEKELKGGEDYSTRPYCLLAAESEEAHKMALDHAREADVCIFGACSQEYALLRATHNPKGLSFEFGERWLKRGLLNILSPVLRTWWKNYQHHYRKANFYKLCASAFAAEDDVKLGCYRNRHFKWGYFADIPCDLVTDRTTGKNQCIRLMWCARFIRWKHPELAIACTKALKKEGYHVLLDMYGDGVLRADAMAYVEKSGLKDVVRFHGNVENAQVREKMRKSDIFLFTSDRQEGWGVVANEAMSAGCCIVAGNKIGAADYLIRDGINGYLFNDRDRDALYMRVKHLIDHPEERIRLSKQAVEDMANLWSPRHAAQSLLQLIDDLQNGREPSIKEGPCSKA